MSLSTPSCGEVRPWTTSSRHVTPQAVALAARPNTSSAVSMVLWAQSAGVTYPQPLTLTPVTPSPAPRVLYARATSRRPIHQTQSPAARAVKSSPPDGEHHGSSRGLQTPAPSRSPNRPRTPITPGSACSYSSPSTSHRSPVAYRRLLAVKLRRLVGRECIVRRGILTGLCCGV